MNKYKRFTHIIVRAIFASGLLACGKSGKDSEQPHSEEALGAVTVPSPYTMSLNFGLSGSGKDLNALAKSDTFTGIETNDSNHMQAMIYVSAVDSNIAHHLILPNRLLEAVAAKQAVQISADTWVYSYEILENNRIWTANLSRKTSSSTATSWAMKVTSSPTDINGCCTDALLFNGQSSSTGSGNWQLYDVIKSMGGAKLFSIVYDLKSATDRILLFTINGNLSQTRFGLNSSVRYSVSGDLRSLELNDISDQGKRLVSWSDMNKSGSYTDPQDNRVCWDGYLESFADLVCK